MLGGGGGKSLINSLLVPDACRFDEITMVGSNYEYCKIIQM